MDSFGLMDRRELADLLEITYLKAGELMRGEELKTRTKPNGRLYTKRQWVEDWIEGRTADGT